MIDPMDKPRALFIRRWGEMAGYWGINRTMAELHALLYISAEPLCSDDIMNALQISRGNTSMNLRQLLNWGLIGKVHHKGDRKEYFVAETDVWEMFDIIIRERRRREVEPIIETIERCRAIVAEQTGALKGEQRREADVVRQRLDNMAEFLNTIMGLLNMFLSGGSGGLGIVRKALLGVAKRAGSR